MKYLYDVYVSSYGGEREKWRITTPAESIAEGGEKAKDMAYELLEEIYGDMEMPEDILVSVEFVGVEIE